jgi:hypothetical protein
MHYAVLNRATVRVADTTDLSGRLTADSINDGSRAERKSSLWHACGLMIFCFVVSVGVLAALAPVPALAAEGGVPEEIAALKKQVAALQSQVQTLQTQLAAVQSNNALKLGKFVTVDPNPEKGVRGPNITFRGANIHIVSGSGATDDNLSHGGTLTGLGNLIIGYDELLTAQVAGRSGSHNLVIGMFHTFTSSAFGGLVAGELNTISAEAASVSGGENNSASGPAASVSGGFGNDARGGNASVSGGENNSASGGEASVSGGFGNDARGGDVSISGGQHNVANGTFSSVSGGQFNLAGGFSASVTGGYLNSANGQYASVSGGAGNFSNSDASSVTGGESNVANGGRATVCGGVANYVTGFEAVVIGGRIISDPNDNSIAPGAPLNYP